MAEHTDPGNKTQEQIEDEAWACFRLRAEGRTVVEIARELELSRETVKRRLSEKILSHETPPREFLKAMQEQRLELYTRELFNALSNPEQDIARLLSSAIQIEKRRAALHGLDEPTRKAIAVTNTGPADDFKGQNPWLSDALADWKRTRIYQEDLRNCGRTEADDLADEARQL
jgi:predicted transcriptional regulator